MAEENGIGVDPRDPANFNNVKNVGEMVSMGAGMFMNQLAQAAARQNDAAVEAQQQDRILSRVATASIINLLLNVDPAESKALTQLFSGDDIADKIMARLASLAGGQEAVKASQTTPPVPPGSVWGGQSGASKL